MYVGVGSGTIGIAGPGVVRVVGSDGSIICLVLLLRCFLNLCVILISFLLCYLLG